MISGTIDSDLQCLGQLRFDHFYSVLRQTTRCYFDPYSDHPLHALRRLLREPKQHSRLADLVPVPLLLQIRLSGPHAGKTMPHLGLSVIMYRTSIPT